MGAKDERHGKSGPSREPAVAVGRFHEPDGALTNPFPHESIEPVAPVARAHPAEPATGCRNPPAPHSLVLLVGAFDPGRRIDAGDANLVARTDQRTREVLSERPDPAVRGGRVFRTNQTKLHSDATLRSDPSAGEAVVAAALERPNSSSQDSNMR